jgi:hypothetical protein
MDWVDGEERPAARTSAGEMRSPRRALDDRLGTWVSRGRELVDGVSGARPGSRAPNRGAERGPGERAGLEGLGRWVEGRLDWLLDDREDWREPWQEGDRPPSRRWEDTPPPPGRSRAPLEAISRRGGGAPAPQPPPLAAPIATPIAEVPGGNGSEEDWPDPETFNVARWRREAPAPRQAATPLTDPPAPPPGRPLPRSTRRR